MLSLLKLRGIVIVKRSGFILSFFLGLLLFGVFLPPLLAEEQPPQIAVENFIATIRGMQFPVQDAAAHRSTVNKANSYLDLESMSKRALGANWETASDQQRKSFLELMWGLIENIAYPHSSHFMGNYQITYPEVQDIGNGFEVHSLIKQDEAALDVPVLYHVYQKESEWKIDDVILDDVSITEDLKYQFDKIIADSQFEGLLTKMREKLSRAQEDLLKPAV